MSGSQQQTNADWTTSVRNAFSNFRPSVPSVLVARAAYTEIPRRQLDLGKVLGAGSFGTVYEGLFGGTQVAIKRFELVDAAAAPALVASIRREVAHLEGMQHPNVVRAFGAVTTEPRELCIVLERAQCSLHDLLHKPGMAPMRASLVAHYAVQIGSGLYFMHERGFSHRDLKSANVLVFAGDVVKLADFGLARATQHAGASVVHSVAGAVGTIPWMAPELHVMVIDPRTGKVVGALSFLAIDAYAYAMVLYELLAGRVPFDEYPNTTFILRALDKGERPALGAGRLVAELEPLAALMRALWATEPAERPLVDRALVAQLQAIATACSTRIDVMPYARKPSAGLQLGWPFSAAAAPAKPPADGRVDGPSEAPAAAEAPAADEAPRASRGGCCLARSSRRARAPLGRAPPRPRPRPSRPRTSSSTWRQPTRWPTRTRASARATCARSASTRSSTSSCPATARRRSCGARSRRACSASPTWRSGARRRRRTRSGRPSARRRRTSARPSSRCATTRAWPSSRRRTRSDGPPRTRSRPSARPTWPWRARSTRWPTRS
jgi:serine/threonine protein kinase